MDADAAVSQQCQIEPEAPPAPITKKKRQNILQQLESKFSQVVRDNPMPALIGEGGSQGDLPTWEQALHEIEQANKDGDPDRLKIQTSEVTEYFE